MADWDMIAHDMNGIIPDMLVADIMNAIQGLARENLVDFGVMDSHKYRARLAQFFIDNQVGQVTRLNIMILSGVISNRDRLISHIEMSTTFPDKDNILRALRLFKTYVKQYDRPEAFPFVNVCHSVPPYAIFGAILNTRYRYNFFDLDNTLNLATLPDQFKKTFLVQLDIDNNFENMQRIWEQEFWENEVKTSKNPNQTAFEKGFHEDYFLTKANDKYKLRSIDDVEAPRRAYTPRSMYTYMIACRLTWTPVGDLYRQDPGLVRNLARFRDPNGNLIGISGTANTFPFHANEDSNTWRDLLGADMPPLSPASDFILELGNVWQPEMREGFDCKVLEGDRPQMGEIPGPILNNEEVHAQLIALGEIQPPAVNPGLGPADDDEGDNDFDEQE